MIDKMKMKDTLKKILRDTLIIIFFLSPIWAVLSYITIFIMARKNRKKECIIAHIVVFIIGIVWMCAADMTFLQVLHGVRGLLTYIFAINPPRLMFASMGGIIAGVGLNYLLSNVSDWMMEEETSKNEVAIPKGEYNYENRTNGLVVGTTRSGKTVAMLHVIETSIRKWESVFIISGKNGANDPYSMASQVKKLCEKYGRELILISTSPDESERKAYNPLEYCTPTEVADILTTVANFSEEHYESNFANWIISIVEVLRKGEKRVSLPNIMALYEYDDFMAHVKNLKDRAVISMQEYRHYSGMRKTAEIAADSKARFMRYIRGEGRDIFYGEKLYSAGYAREQNAVFLLDLDGLTYRHFSNALGTMALGDIQHVIANEKDFDKQKLLVLDEVSVFYSEYMPSIYAMASGYKYQVISGTQSFSDLARISHELEEVIIENAHQFGFLLQNSAEDAEKAAAICGTRNEIELTKKVNGIAYDPAGSQKVVDVYRVHPNVIKTLEPLNMIYYAKANNPDLCRVKWEFLNFEDEESEEPDKADQALVGNELLREFL